MSKYQTVVKLTRWGASTLWHSEIEASSLMAAIRRLAAEMATYEGRYIVEIMEVSEQAPSEVEGE